jgi:archaeal chaperonin
MASGESTGQPIILLREGTSRTRGLDAQSNNITAAKVVAEMIRSSMGPKGMDKMIVDTFGDITITNDGATILKEMDIQHPAAKMMTEVANNQDSEVGDGTTTVVVMTGELLAKAQDLIDKDIHATIIIDGYRKAAQRALEIYDEIAIRVKSSDKSVLRKIAMTSLYSKIASENGSYLADLVVDAVLQVTEKNEKTPRLDIDDIKVEKKVGGSILDTSLIQGIIVDKEIVHSGMARRIEKARIALLDGALEVEKTEFEAKLSIKRPEQMQAFLDAEEKIIRDMVDGIAKSGATFIVCQKGIDDLAQYLLAEKGISAVRRVKKSDIEKLSKATGGKIVTNITDLSSKDLGYADLVEERKIADDRMTFIEGCRNAKAVSLLIRGGTERVIDEVERSIHDALSVVKDVILEPKMVAGGGAPEEEVAMRLRATANQISGRKQLAVLDFADAMESVPMALAENAGLNPIDILVEMRSSHEKGVIWSGVNPFRGKVEDMSELEVFEPASVKKQIIRSATEATSMILRIDDVIASSKMKTGPAGPKPAGDEANAGD